MHTLARTPRPPSGAKLRLWTRWQSQTLASFARPPGRGRPGLPGSWWYRDDDLKSQGQIRVKAIEGKLNAGGKHFAIVVSRFNAFITDRLLQSAFDGLVQCGAKDKDIKIVRVPGAFEIPSASRTLAKTRKYDAIVCLGCLLRGDTAHYDVIVNEVARGIGQSAQETGVPHAFGILTCENLEQAIDRAGLKMGNKGFEAALAAVEMASLKEAVGPQLPALSKKTKSRQATRSSKRR